MEKFFRFSSSNQVLSTEGLRAIELTMEEELSVPCLTFVYDSFTVDINFESDNDLMDYYCSLTWFLGVITIESDMHCKEHKEILKK